MLDSDDEEERETNGAAKGKRSRTNRTPAGGHRGGDEDGLSAMAKAGQPRSSAASGPLVSLHQNLLLMSRHSPSSASSSASSSVSSLSKGPAGRAGGAQLHPLLPLPAAGGHPLAMNPQLRGAGVVPLLPRPSPTATSSPDVVAFHSQRLPLMAAGGGAARGTTMISGTATAGQAPMPQPLEVRSVSVGPNGVGLALDEGRTMQLRRAEDLAPLYAHALAQLRAACDLLFVREREIAALRRGGGAPSLASPLMARPFAQAGAPSVMHRAAASLSTSGGHRVPPDAAIASVCDAAPPSVTDGDLHIVQARPSP